MNDIYNGTLTDEEFAEYYTKMHNSAARALCMLGEEEVDTLRELVGYPAGEVGDRTLCDIGEGLFRAMLNVLDLGWRIGLCISGRFMGSQDACATILGQELGLNYSGSDCERYNRSPRPSNVLVKADLTICGMPTGFRDNNVTWTYDGGSFSSHERVAMRDSTRLALLPVYEQVVRDTTLLLEQGEQNHAAWGLLYGVCASLLVIGLSVMYRAHAKLKTPAVVVLQHSDRVKKRAPKRIKSRAVADGPKERRVDHGCNFLERFWMRGGDFITAHNRAFAAIVFIILAKMAYESGSAVQRAAFLLLGFSISAVILQVIRNEDMYTYTEIPIQRDEPVPELPAIASAPVEAAPAIDRDTKNDELLEVKRSYALIVAENERLKKEKAISDSEKAISDSKYEQLCDKHSGTTKELKVAQKKGKDIEAERHAVATELGEERTRFAVASRAQERENADLSERLQIAEHSLREMEKKCRAMQNEKAGQDTLISHLNKKSAAQDARIKHLEDSIVKSTSEFGTMYRDDMDTQRIGFEREIVELKRQIGAKQKEVDTLKWQLALVSPEPELSITDVDGLAYSGPTM